MDMSREYVLKASANGGVVIMEVSRDLGRFPEMIGAFTTPADMIKWLADQYGLTSVISTKAPAKGPIETEDRPQAKPSPYPDECLVNEDRPSRPSKLDGARPAR